MQNLQQRLYSRFVRTEKQTLATEQEMAGALLVCCSALLVLNLLGSSGSSVVLRGLLIGLWVYAAGLMLYLYRAQAAIRGLSAAIHLGNLGWAGAIGWAAGDGNALFVLCVFIVLSAAYRWHLRLTLLTTATVVLLTLAAAHLRHFLGDATAHAADLLLIGLISGAVSNRLKGSAAQLALLNRLTADITADISLKKTMTAVAHHLKSIFGQEQVLLAFQEIATGEMFVVESHSSAAKAHWRKATLPEQHCLFFPHSFRAAALSRNGGSRVSAEDDSGGSSALLVPPGIWECFPSPALLVLRVMLAEEWEIRAYIPRASENNASALRLLDVVAAQLQPSISNAYMLRGVRNQAMAMERGRIARELHDGSIQTMISLEMQLAMLAGSERTPDWLADELHRLKNLMRGEVLSLREMMARLHPVRVNPRNLVQSLSEVTEEFRRRTAMNIHFVSETERVNLPPRICQELISILQEALVNVRKHSGARTVVVRLASSEEGWRLQIDDDGRGFDFSGDFSLFDLDREKRGPVVIKERVRVIGGQLRIQSTPGKGAQVEVTIPIA